MKPDTNTQDDGSSKSECAVCLQPYVQPVQLPCRHIFCYLCVKGVTNQNNRCAMCRQEIPATYLDNPHLIAAPSPSVMFEGSYQWFYAGRNGWWQYDDRTSAEIEAAHQKGDKVCEVLIAGFLYVIDLEKSVQFRKNDPYRRRHIKRDLVSSAIKGIGGIRIVSNQDIHDDGQSESEEDVESDGESVQLNAKVQTSNMDLNQSSSLMEDNDSVIEEPEQPSPSTSASKRSCERENPQPGRKRRRVDPFNKAIGEAFQTATDRILNFRREEARKTQQFIEKLLEQNQKLIDFITKK